MEQAPRHERRRRHRQEEAMSDNDLLDVLIAVYLIPDLAQQDFDAFVKLAEDGRSRPTGWPSSPRTPRVRWRCRRRATTSDARAQGRRRSGSRRGSLRAAAPRRHGGRSGRRRLLGKVARKRVQAGSARRWTTRCHPARRGSSRSTTMTTPMPSPGRSATHPLVDRADRQGLREGAQGGSRGGVGRARRLRR